MKLYKYSSLLFSLIAVTSPVIAIDEAIEEITTATRTPQSIDETLASVTLITKEDIEQSQAANLSELLVGIIGIDVTRTGWYGQSSDYYIRGLSSRYVLVLVDGIRLGSAANGRTDLEGFGLDHIERIEIVRGARSSLYGSDAIGAVIQIFTNSKNAPKQTYIKTGYGSYGTASLAAGISGGSDKTQLKLNFSHLNTDGAIVPDGGEDGEGYEAKRISASIRQQISDTSTLALSIYQSQGTADDNRYDDPYGDCWSDCYKERTRETFQQSVSSTLTFTPTNSWDIKLQAGTSTDENNYKGDGLTVDTFHTQRKQFSWQNNFTLADSSLLTLGIDNIDEEVNPEIKYFDTKRAITGSFAEIQQNYGNQDVLIGLRHDKYHSLGGYTTGNFDWGYRLSENLRVTANYGNAFKAPTFEELYEPFTTNVLAYNNPNLRPEKSKHFEAGLRWRKEATDWTVTAFRTKIEDLIDMQCVSGCNTTLIESHYQLRNIKSAQIEGVEGSATHHYDNLGLEAKISLTLLDPRDLETGEILPNRSSTTLRVDLNKKIEKWRHGIRILVQDSRYFDVKFFSFNFGRGELKGYTSIDLNTHYALSKNWAIKGKINNLLNEAYLTTDGNYPPSARTFLLSASYKIM